MINGIVLQKMQTLDEVLTELRSLLPLRLEQLEKDWRTRRAVERNLQVAVEIVIDVCQRLIHVTGQSPATTGRDAVERCIQGGILSDYDPFRKMVQFRYFIVHRYERIDPVILADIVNSRLSDFERFRDEVLAYVRRELDEK